MSAWTVIEHREVGSGGVSSIDLTSISGSYTDLCLVLSLRTNVNANFDDMGLRLNGDTVSSSNYSFRLLRTRDGTVVSAATASTHFVPLYEAAGNTATSNTFGNTVVYFPNYSGSTSKSFSIDGYSENNSVNVQGGIVACLYSPTTAITSISIYSQNSATIQQYSSATLWGITKGSSGGVTVS